MKVLFIGSEGSHREAAKASEMRPATNTNRAGTSTGKTGEQK